MQITNLKADNILDEARTTRGHLTGQRPDRFQFLFRMKELEVQVKQVIRVLPK